MNKKALIITITIAIIAGLALFAARRTLAMYANQQTETAVVEVEDVQADFEAGEGQAAASALEAPQAAENGLEHADTAYSEAPASELSDAEKEALLYMREEEKLAHDVYVTLSSQWASSLGGEDVFARIIQSELAHMDAVAGLLERCRRYTPGWSPRAANRWQKRSRSVRPSRRSTSSTCRLAWLRRVTSKSSRSSATWPALPAITCARSQPCSTRRRERFTSPSTSRRKPTQRSSAADRAAGMETGRVVAARVAARTVME